MGREKKQHSTHWGPKKKWLRISIHPGENMMSLLVQDITKQKTQKLELKRNRRNLAYLMDNLDDLAWSVDLNYKFLSFNRAYADRRKTLKDVEVEKGLDPEKWSRAMNVKVDWTGYFERVLRDYKTIREVHSEKMSSQQVHFEIRVYPILNRKNRVEGLGCVSRDITDIKVYEQVISEQNEVMSAVARFQSHQIRRTVANILGAIELLQSEPEVVDRTEYRKIIKQSVDELDEMIKTIVSQAYSARSIRD